MRIFKLILVGTLITGCGKFGDPVPPEAVSPRAVDALEVKADPTAVTIKWEAPETDLQGKELKFIDGYRVYRKAMENQDELLNDEFPFEIIATLTDTHLIELEKMREKARAENKPTRRLKVDEALTRFEYADKSVSAGKLYAYRIVPFNQGDVEGQVSKIIRVRFRGDSSEIIMIDESQFEEEFVTVE